MLLNLHCQTRKHQHMPRQERTKSGDGKNRLMLEIRGNYKGKDGVFEFIKEQNGEINHRYF